MTQRPKRITFFSTDLANNNVVRSVPIVKVLARRYEVETVGPLFGDDQIYLPYRDELAWRAVRAPGAAEMRPRSWARLWGQLAAIATGDVLYAFKPMLGSFGAALWACLHRRRPVILDIEDWDAAPFHQLNARARRSPRQIGRLLRFQYAAFDLRLAELLIPLATKRVVSSTFLQDRYGGTRVVQGVDCRVFDPSLFARGPARDALGIDPSDIVVLFAGTIGPHKGVDDLVAAIRAAARSDLRLLVAGPTDDPALRLAAAFPDIVRLLGPRPHTEMPPLLCAADIVCLPQRDVPYARAQIPAKVFEAMAMEKAIVATAVSDLPEILSDCGIVVQPNDLGALSRALAMLAGDPTRRSGLGARARARCKRLYSWDAMEDPLVSVVEATLSGGRRAHH